MAHVVHLLGLSAGHDTRLIIIINHAIGCQVIMNTLTFEVLTTVKM
jgi:hypothetical protein